MCVLWITQTDEQCVQYILSTIKIINYFTTDAVFNTTSYILMQQNQKSKDGILLPLKFRHYFHYLQYFITC